MRRARGTPTLTSTTRRVYVPTWDNLMQSLVQCAGCHQENAAPEDLRVVLAMPTVGDPDLLTRRRSSLMYGVQCNEWNSRRILHVRMYYYVLRGKLTGTTSRASRSPAERYVPDASKRRQRRGEGIKEGRSQDFLTHQYSLGPASHDRGK